MLYFLRLKRVKTGNPLLLFFFFFKFLTMGWKGWKLIRLALVHPSASMLALLARC